MATMKFKALRQAVYEANMELPRRGLVMYSWGNVSAIDRAAQVVAIKPSGVPYETLSPDQIVVLDPDGCVVDGDLRPSSDTPTHLELYRAFEGIGAVCHTHARHTVMWAQAARPIPCFGTTHADFFYGAVPVTEPMRPEEIETDYELNTGRVIVRRFVEDRIDPMQMPAVLVAGHGPFTWGPTAAKAVEAMVVIEEVARMALGTIQIEPNTKGIHESLLNKHYFRKHGEGAYYGQP